MKKRAEYTLLKGRNFMVLLKVVLRI